MLIQSLLIGLIFFGSVSYVALLVWRAFQAPANGAGCAKGCGTCEVAQRTNRQLALVPVRAKRS